MIAGLVSTAHVTTALGLVLLSAGAWVQWWCGRWVGNPIGPRITATRGSSAAVSLFALLLIVGGVLLAGGGWAWLGVLAWPVAGALGKSLNPDAPGRREVEFDRYMEEAETEAELAAQQVAQEEPHLTDNEARILSDLV